MFNLFRHARRNSQGKTAAIPEIVFDFQYPRDHHQQAVATLLLPAGWGLLPNEEDGYHAIGHAIYLKPGPYTLDLELHCGHDVLHPITFTKRVEVVLDHHHRIHLPKASERPPQ